MFKETRLRLGVCCKRCNVRRQVVLLLFLCVCCIIPAVLVTIQLLLMRGQGSCQQGPGWLHQQLRQLWQQQLSALVQLAADVGYCLLVALQTAGLQQLCYSSHVLQQYSAHLPVVRTLSLGDLAAMGSSGSISKALVLGCSLQGCGAWELQRSLYQAR
jgi:hypothetical protein